MKKKVKISKSGMISLIGLVFGFAAVFNSLSSLDNIIIWLFSGWSVILGKIILPLVILFVCFMHIWRMNKPCKSQAIYAILGVVSVGLCMCNLIEFLMMLMYGNIIWNMAYISAIITIVGIIIEFIILGIAENLRGKELCTE